MPCTGSCCVAFPICGHDLSSIRTNTTTQNGDLLGFMLRPLTFVEVLERDQQFGVERERHRENAYYHCIYWDEDTRLCGAYENRPEMCRAYPYGKKCEHGCDCKDGK